MLAVAVSSTLYSEFSSMVSEDSSNVISGGLSSSIILSVSDSPEDIVALMVSPGAISTVSSSS